MDQIQRDFVEFYQHIGKSYVSDPLSVKLVSILFLEPEEISLEDLAQKSGFSPASISNKVKFLESLGVVKRQCRPGSKRVYVYTEKDLFKVVREQLIRKQELLVSVCKSGLPEIIEKNEGKHLTEKEKQEIKILKNYLKQAQVFESLLQEMLKKIEGVTHEK